MVFCTHCQLGKSHKLTFVSSHMRSQVPFSLSFLHLWTFPIVSSIGDLYFLTIVDNFTRFTWMFPLKSKRLNYFHFYAVFYHNKKQFDCVINSIQIDGDYEFKSLVLTLVNKMELLRVVLDVLLRRVSLCFFSLMFPKLIAY